VKRRRIDDPLFAYARLAGTSPLRLPLDERLDRFRGHTDPFEPRVDTRDAEAGSGSEASTVKISNIISSPDHKFISLSREGKGRPFLSLPILPTEVRERPIDTMAPSPPAELVRQCEISEEKTYPALEKRSAKQNELGEMGLLLRDEKLGDAP
jgi:hypothetical protein